MSVKQVTSCSNLDKMAGASPPYCLCKGRLRQNWVAAPSYHQDRPGLSSIDRGHLVSQSADSGPASKDNIAQSQAHIDHEDEACAAAQLLKAKEGKVKENVLEYIQGHYNTCVTT